MPYRSVRWKNPVTLASLFEPTTPRGARGGYVTFAAWVIVTGIALALHADPAGHGTHKQLGLAACPSVVLFGRPCPGCGMTTSWTALVHGDLPSALHAHLMGPLAYVAFTAVAFLSLAAARRGQRLMTEGRPMTRALAVFAIVFFGYAFWRFGTTPHYGTASEAFLGRTLTGQPLTDRPLTGRP